MYTKNTTNIDVILYTSKKLANGEFPLMLRVTKNKSRKYHSIGISCTKDQWDFARNTPKRNHPDKELLEQIINDVRSDYREQVKEFKSQRREFTAQSLIDKVENPIKRITVIQFFNNIIKRLEISGKIGNANVYKDTMRSIEKFSSNKDLLFSEIDISFLNNYEAFLRSNSMTDSGISVYFRTLRALFNKAILENFAKKKDYPFDVFKISKFKSIPHRRAITKSKIDRIIALKIDFASKMYEARQYFLFSYYGSGINFKDIALLRWENINNDRIFYIRSKTGKTMNFKILEPLRLILAYHKRFTGSKQSNYIFPILDINIHKSPMQIDNRIHKVITRVNKELKEIGKLAKVEIPLTTYVARHSMATILKFSGVETPLIKEIMGHEGLATTEGYLNSFGDEILDKALEKLL